MERRPEAPSSPAAEHERATGKERSENAKEHVETDTETFDKDRAEILAQDRDRLAQEYSILRDTLIELREKGMDEPKAREEYERIRAQYLGQIVELHARGDLTDTESINDEGLSAIHEGHRGEQGKATTTFELGIRNIVRKVSGNKDFNDRFDMLIQNRPEGEEALLFLEKLLPEIYTKTAKAEQQKKTQLSREANMPQSTQGPDGPLREAFDDIKEMLQTERAKDKPRMGGRKGGRPHGIRKPSFITRLKDAFGGKRKAG